MKGIFRNIARNGLVILAVHFWAIILFGLYVLPYLPHSYAILICFVFVATACILSIVLFDTKLYFLVGKKKTDRVGESFY
jgi:uncharacterized membrane protein